MIFCNFCAGKSQKSYLYLSCKHLSCLSCAFLRAQFSSQQILCCNTPTRIDDQSMETIIRSKRHINTFKQVTNQDQTLSSKQKLTQTKHMENSSIIQQINKQNHQKTLEPPKKIKQYEIKQKQKSQKQQIQNLLQNMLISQIERIRKHFQKERQFLKEKEQESLKNLMLNYEQQIKNYDNPLDLTDAQIQSIQLSLNRKMFPVDVKMNLCDPKNKQERVVVSSRDFSTGLRQSRESYDHILKRLQINQERMKQKIQKHMQFLY